MYTLKFFEYESRDIYFFVFNETFIYLIRYGWWENLFSFIIFYRFNKSNQSVINISIKFFFDLWPELGSFNKQIYAETSMNKTWTLDTSSFDIIDKSHFI